MRKRSTICGALCAIAALGIYAGLTVLAAGTPPRSNTTIVMAGDSITARADWQGLTGCSSIENIAAPNATARDLLALVPAIKERRPAAVVVMSGINDLSLGRAAVATADDIITFARDLRADGIDVVILKTLPVTAKAELTAHVRSAVDRTNAILSSAPSFVVSTDYLLDESGFFDRDYALADGLHPSPAGYAAWAIGLRPVIRQFCRQD
jgi:lysophospholipase L1-like esterase